MISLWICTHAVDVLWTIMRPWRGYWPPGSDLAPPQHRSLHLNYDSEPDSGSVRSQNCSMLRLDSIHKHAQDVATTSRLSTSFLELRQNSPQDCQNLIIASVDRATVEISRTIIRLNATFSQQLQQASISASNGIKSAQDSASSSIGVISSSASVATSSAFSSVTVARLALSTANFAFTSVSSASISDVAKLSSSLSLLQANLDFAQVESTGFSRLGSLFGELLRYIRHCLRVGFSSVFGSGFGSGFCDRTRADHDSYLSDNGDVSTARNLASRQSSAFRTGNGITIRVNRRKSPNIPSVPDLSVFDKPEYSPTSQFSEKELSSPASTQQSSGNPAPMIAAALAPTFMETEKIGTAISLEDSVAPATESWSLKRENQPADFSQTFRLPALSPLFPLDPAYQAARANISVAHPPKDSLYKRDNYVGQKPVVPVPRYFTESKPSVEIEAAPTTVVEKIVKEPPRFIFEEPVPKMILEPVAEVIIRPAEIIDEPIAQIIEVSNENITKNPIKYIMKEPVEAIIDELPDKEVPEPAEETLLEQVEETVAEPAEEMLLDPVEEAIEDPTLPDEPAEEIIEEPAEEVIEESFAEEPVVEEPVVEHATVEEPTVEEPILEESVEDIMQDPVSTIEEPVQTSFEQEVEETPEEQVFEEPAERPKEDLAPPTEVQTASPDPIFDEEDDILEDSIIPEIDTLIQVISQHSSFIEDDRLSSLHSDSSSRASSPGSDISQPKEDTNARALAELRERTISPLRRNPVIVASQDEQPVPALPIPVVERNGISPLRRNPPDERPATPLVERESSFEEPADVPEDEEPEPRGRSMVRTSDIIEARLSAMMEAAKAEPVPKTEVQIEDRSESLLRNPLLNMATSEDLLNDRTLSPLRRNPSNPPARNQTALPAMSAAASADLMDRTLSPLRRNPSNPRLPASSLSTIATADAMDRHLSPLRRNPSNPPAEHQVPPLAPSLNSLARPIPPGVAGALSGTDSPHRALPAPVLEPARLQRPAEPTLKPRSSTQFSQALSKFQNLAARNRQDTIKAASEVTSRAIAGIYIPGSLREQAVRGIYALKNSDKQVRQPALKKVTRSAAYR
ncbi:hypothetical protein GQ53DRAFT_767980 [Thozetella sp. PMI_491]|nr:hypothetical protein GQ53DRAFT_767980 [Thozetella sp. PMI_491]